MSGSITIPINSITDARGRLADAPNQNPQPAPAPGQEHSGERLEAVYKLKGITHVTTSGPISLLDLIKDAVWVIDEEDVARRASQEEQLRNALAEDARRAAASGQ